MCVCMNFSIYFHLFGPVAFICGCLLLDVFCLCLMRCLSVLAIVIIILFLLIHRLKPAMLLLELTKQMYITVRSEYHDVFTERKKKIERKQIALSYSRILGCSNSFKTFKSFICLQNRKTN